MRGGQKQERGREKRGEEGRKDEGGSRGRGGGERRVGMEGGSSEATQILFFLEANCIICTRIVL